VISVSRGTHSYQGARWGRQAPRPGRQGALLDDVTRVGNVRPGDPVAVARGAAEEEQ
jgi:fermentation-respiration switch protein FrsA (DUF1100 family)